MALTPAHHIKTFPTPEMSLSDLIKKFQFERILSRDPVTKTLAILGLIKNQFAIVTLEKTAFQYQNQDLTSFFDKFENFNDINHNDVYFWGLGWQKLIEKFPSAKVNLIYPATLTHIQKYDEQKFQLIKETPQMYEKIVKPYISTMKGDRIKWVKNILYEGAEAEQVIYKDSDFVLMPDMKWDGTTMESLYLCAIVYNEEISSIRDLKASHVDWLTSILVKLRNVIPKHYHYAIRPDEIRLFVHYQPSYYHFHIHAVNIKHQGLGSGIAAGKAILLEEVIEQLRLLGEGGFMSKTITYAIGENHDLWRLGLKDAHYRNMQEMGIELVIDDERDGELEEGSEFANSQHESV